MHAVPCYLNAPIEKRTNTLERDDRFPLFIWSHGVGGNFDVYSQLLCDFASFGIIVVAVEHCDGTACFTSSSHGDILYKSEMDAHKQYVFIVKLTKKKLCQTIRKYK